jgi:ABC-type multidrug transport system ATPase subunit
MAVDASTLPILGVQAVHAEGARYYCYPDRELPAVDGMTLSMTAGEVFGFLGPSGAGKTTTQRAILGLVDGWTGTIKVLGKDRREWGPELLDRVAESFEPLVGYPLLTGREHLAHLRTCTGPPPGGHRRHRRRWPIDAADVPVGRRGCVSV